MAERIKRKRRAYHSPLRADQARRTRERVLQAASRLFAERGYAGTTVRAVAAEAGVSPETVYALGGKRRLLEDVIEAAIAGRDDGRADEEELSAAVAALLDPRERLASMVEHSCRILARTAPFHAIIRGAADKERFAANLGRRLLRERLAAQTERLRRHLARDLRRDLSVEEAGQRYCALVSPELYYLLTVELGWTAARHRDWLAEVLTAQLLQPR